MRGINELIRIRQEFNSANQPSPKTRVKGKKKQYTKQNKIPTKPQESANTSQ
jgi:hypothetical protein